jgi:hypothetical protein
MFASLAQKLLPHISYLIAGQVVLLGLALMLGGYIFLRYYFKKRPFDGDPAIESKEIALQIQAEITRLTELRNRVAPGLAGSFSSSGPSVVTATTPSTSIQSEGESTSTDPNSIQKIQDLEAAHKLQIEEFNKKIASLEAELSTPKTARISGTPAGDSNNVTIAGVDPGNKDVQKLKLEFEKEKSTLTSQVTHLETVISEYKIFEEDFALVKKYKSENDDLKNQITALTSQVKALQTSEANPSATPATSAQGFSTPTPAQEAAPKSPKMTDEDISSLFATLENGKSTQQAEEVAPQSAPPPAAAPAATLANTAPPASVSEIEAFFKDQDATAPQGSGDAADALLAELAAAQSASASPAPDAVSTQASATPLTQEAAPAPGFDSEKVTKEPKIANPAEAKSDLETLAESAASDDQLMQEFQKLLESEKPS